MATALLRRGGVNRGVPIRIRIRILSVLLLAAILVSTRLLHLSLHLEASNLNINSSPEDGSPYPYLDISSKEYSSPNPPQQERYRYDQNSSQLSFQDTATKTTTPSHVNVNTPSQNKTAASWEFSANKTALLSRSISTFRSIWHEVQGQECQKIVMKRLPRLQRHVNSLDIYVVSHGGVGSNAIIDYMEQNTSLHAKGDDEELYRQSCHLGSPVWVPLVRQQPTPTLVLIGDFWRALCSMKKRKWLRMNIAKNLYGGKECKKDRFRKFYMQTFPRDPAAIKMMLLTYILYPESTVILQAPYTKDSINTALTLLGRPDLVPQMEHFSVRDRGSNYSQDAKDFAPLLPMYQPYHRLEEILGEMPRAWKASETPQKLYRYLLDEFSE